MSTAAIGLVGLAKYYGPIVGVEDLTLDVEPGEIFGFLGVNGAGKTTTIRLIVDLLRPSRGRAAVFGVDCHRQSLEARRLIGYLPGELPIYPDLTARGYLSYLRALDGRVVDDRWLAELLRRFNVSDLDLSRRLRVQSHGMKQKIGIIQALMGRAPVLILDEPTAGLDPLMVFAFQETLGNLKRRGDTTVFLSSHVLAEVEQTCDRIGIVRDGRMGAVGTVDELRRAAAREVIVQFSTAVTGDLEVPGARLLSSTPTERVYEVRGPLGPLLAALATFPVHDIRERPFKLEDYVVKLYSQETQS
jgi:ABC-type multidrug transport system ATPase subunit